MVDIADIVFGAGTGYLVYTAILSHLEYRREMKLLGVLKEGLKYARTHNQTWEDLLYYCGKHKEENPKLYVSIKQTLLCRILCGESD